MTARFVLSLDCEGRWGIADDLGSAHARALDDRSLRQAYRQLLDVLDALAIPATFAFVGTFTLDRPGLRAVRGELAALAARAPGYLEPAIDQIDDGEGWSGDWAVDAVGSASVRHELALHGGTHLPWLWPGVTDDVARADLALAFDAAPEFVRHVRTFIPPRNQVAHRHVLTEFGIAGSRDARPLLGRAASLRDELDPRMAPDPDPPPAVPVRVPAGRFVNWRHGPRRLVPPAVTRMRFRRALETATRTGDVVHCWTHPENLASGPGTLDLLAGVLTDAARLRDAGRCEVLTQADYCVRADPAAMDDARARRDARLAAR